MQLKDFDYYLPPNLIATKPVRPRDHSRLLVLDKKTGATEHNRFFNIVDHLAKGDVLVFNNSKVIPAKLVGRKSSGGRLEMLLNRPLESGVWEVMVRGRARVGAEIDFGKGLSAELLKDQGDGAWQARFGLQGGELMRKIDEVGMVPLPPYIAKARGEDYPGDADRSDYQTVYAKTEGSVAAPTAGLHFTDELLAKLSNKGVEFREITLHVGLGTFLPVKSDDIAGHKMHAEAVEISAATAQALSSALAEKRRVVAVGTTTCRSLEAAFSSIKAGREFGGLVDIFIYPPYEFQVVDAMITNFHLPKSTLLMLVSALAGRKNMLSAYQEAIDKNYRFYSYGDAMLIK